MAMAHNLICAVFLNEERTTFVQKLSKFLVIHHCLMLIKEEPQMNSKVAVLIPCYNESLTIAKVVAEFKQALPNADIYVFDNNSTDGSDELAKSAGAIVHYEYKQGKGNVMRTMFRDIQADCYLMTDADDAFPADIAQSMINLILEGKADMVCGDRLSSTYFSQNKRRFHGAGNIIIKKLVNIFFGGNIKDIMTGYRAFSPLFVKTFPILSKGFEIETEMTIHALDKNLKIIEMPAQYRDRPEGSVSKLHTFKDGFKVLLTIFTLVKDYRPLPFFSLFALLLTALSGILFAPVFIEYLQTGLVPRFPTLIVSMFMLLSALLSLSCGLILDSLKRRERQEMEFKLNLMQMIRYSNANKEKK